MMNKELEIIREFANKMGYEINEYEYIHCRNHKKCYCIELLGTYDSEGENFDWAWYLDNGERVL